MLETLPLPPLRRGETERGVLPKGYTYGTHRLREPHETLAQIAPHLDALEITRCADVTGLDHAGIPVYCAIRPTGQMLQLSNGKGLNHANARVSALMEAIEHYHAENPDGRLRRTSQRVLAEAGAQVVDPASLPLFRTGVYYTPDFVIDWVQGEDLLNGETVWLPASAIYFCSPSFYGLSTNGLASGNHLVEATLHGLCEVIERDAVSRLFVDGRLRLDPARCRQMRPETVDDPGVRELLDRLDTAQIKVVLFWVVSCVPMHTFWAILLERHSLAYSTMVHEGSGSHLSLPVAAIRAISEAAQSRLTYIHGARENIVAKVRTPAAGLIETVYSFFDRLEPDTPWQALQDLSTADLLEDTCRVLAALREAGYPHVYRVDLTQPRYGIPVAKVLVPGLIKHNLF